MTSAFPSSGAPGASVRIAARGTPQRGRLRRLWFNVHLWLGVALGVLLIPLGLTGSVLVWTDAIQRVGAPAVSSAPARLPPSAYLRGAGEALEGKGRPVSLTWPERAGDPVVVTARARPPGPRAAAGASRGRPRPIMVRLDPADGHVVSVGDPRPGWWRAVHSFHENLLVQGWGRSVVGWLGVAMLISSLTGIWLWWPRAGSLLKALRFRRAPGFWLSLHYTAGFWISLPLAFVSLTGIGLGFPQQARALIGQAVPISAPGQPGGPGRGGGEEGRGGRFHPTLDADRALAAIGAPPGAVRTLTLPTGVKPVWRAELTDGQVLEVADATGQVAPGAPPLAGDQTWRWLHRLHGGTDMPLVWRLIVTLTGLAPTLLGITGVSVWIAKSRRRKSLAMVS